jgi:murein DD-endopeptidase MepM/ murein hydrolase activator NlpD
MAQTKSVGSSISSSVNNIVNFSRSKSTMRRTQTSYNEFLKFMDAEVQALQSIKLPKKEKIQNLSNLNVASTFGNTGNLLSSLVSGAFDIGGFLGNFFGGGKNKQPLKAAEREIEEGALKGAAKGGRFRLPGVKGIPILSTLLTGLDFADRKMQGQTNLQAGAGAGGALAGSVLAGIVAAPLEAVPGVGFLLHGAAIAGGAMLGGSIADKLTGADGGGGVGGSDSGIKEKTKEKLKAQEAKQKASAAATKTLTFPEVLNKFDSVISNFEKAVASGLLGASSAKEGEGTSKSDKELMEGDLKSEPNTNKQDGEIGDYSVSGGTTPSSKRGSPFGMRNGRNHNGIDYRVDAGTPISVIQPGTVSVANMNYNPGGWGALVEIQHPDGSSTRYAHLSKISVSQGQKIEPGTLIGYSGGKPGAFGAGNSTGEHLHYEYLPKGSGAVDPSSGNNDDKYFRFGGNVQIKPKVTSQTGVMGQNGKQTVVLAAGTNDYGDPATAKANVTKAIKDLQSKGFNVVVIPPNENGKFAAVSKTVQEAATASGATIEKGKYEKGDPLHLEMSEASRIRGKYSGSEIVGDSNAVRIAGGSMKNVAGKRVVGAGTDDILKFAQGMGATTQKSQVQSVPQQNTAAQQIESYPSYNQPQTSQSVIMPIVMGGGGSAQVPSSGGGGSVGSGGGGNQPPMIIPASQGKMLNSLFSTILLTSLSST